MQIIFILDTSPSMSQRISNGFSLLDCAKSAIEQFVRARMRDHTNRNDRLGLITCEGFPAAVKVFDKSPYSRFLEVVKAVSVSNTGFSKFTLQRTLDLLRLQCVAADMNNFGEGRFPALLETSAVVMITDGTEPSLTANLPEIGFEWNQRCFATILRIGCDTNPFPHSFLRMDANKSDSSLSKFCESTGGKLTAISTYGSLLNHMDNLCARITPAVVVSLCQLTPQASEAPHKDSCMTERKLIFVSGARAQGASETHFCHFPIPEPLDERESEEHLTLDLNLPAPTDECPAPAIELTGAIDDCVSPVKPIGLNLDLGVKDEPVNSSEAKFAQESNPRIYFQPLDVASNILPSFPSDKFDVEASMLNALLSKESPGACFNVFIKSSSTEKCNFGSPFGYVTLNPTSKAVNLVVLPYNYPALFDLLRSLQSPKEMAAPPQLWVTKFKEYVSKLPKHYCCDSLKNALKKYGVNFDSFLEKTVFGVPKNAVAKKLLLEKKQAKSKLQEIVGSNIDKFQSCQHQLVKLPVVGEHVASFPPIPEALLKTNLSDDLKSSDSLDSRIPFTCPSLGLKETPAVTGQSSRFFGNPFDVHKEDLISKLEALPLLFSQLLNKKLNDNALSHDLRLSNLANLGDKLLASRITEGKCSLPVDKMGLDISSFIARSNSTEEVLREVTVNDPNEVWLDSERKIRKRENMAASFPVQKWARKGKTFRKALRMTQETSTDPKFFLNKFRDVTRRERTHLREHSDPVKFTVAVFSATRDCRGDELGMILEELKSTGVEGCKVHMVRIMDQVLERARSTNQVRVSREVASNGS